MTMQSRRKFVCGAVAGLAATAAAASPSAKPQLGVVAGATGKTNPDQALAHVRSWDSQVVNWGSGWLPATWDQPFAPRWQSIR